VVHPENSCCIKVARAVRLAPSRWRRAVAPPGVGQVVTFAEMTQALGVEGLDWEFAYLMLCDTATDGTFVYVADGDPTRILDSEREDFRESLRARLSAEWPVYIQQLDDAGKLRWVT